MPEALQKAQVSFIILSKNHVGRDRLDISEDEVWSTRDFAERLSLQFHGQTQQEYFGGGTTVSLEGVAIKFVKGRDASNDVSTTTDFHTFLSNGKQQDSAVVYNHFEKLLKFLKAEGVIKNGSTILCNTDGCSSQYRCGTAFYFLSALSYVHKVAISRAVGAPGHG